MTTPVSISGVPDDIADVITQEADKHGSKSAAGREMLALAAAQISDDIEPTRTEYTALAHDTSGGGVDAEAVQDIISTELESRGLTRNGSEVTSHPGAQGDNEPEEEQTNETAEQYDPNSNVPGDLAAPDNDSALSKPALKDLAECNPVSPINAHHIIPDPDHRPRKSVDLTIGVLQHRYDGSVSKRQIKKVMLSDNAGLGLSYDETDDRLKQKIDEITDELVSHPSDKAKWIVPGHEGDYLADAYSDVETAVNWCRNVSWDTDIKSLFDDVSDRLNTYRELADEAGVEPEETPNKHELVTEMKRLKAEEQRNKIQSLADSVSEKVDDIRNAEVSRIDSAVSSVESDIDQITEIRDSFTGSQALDIDGVDAITEIDGVEHTVDELREHVELAAEVGRPIERHTDALDWLEQERQRRRDARHEAAMLTESLQDDLQVATNPGNPFDRRKVANNGLETLSEIRDVVSDAEVDAPINIESAENRLTDVKETCIDVLGSRWVGFGGELAAQNSDSDAKTDHRKEWDDLIAIHRAARQGGHHNQIDTQRAKECVNGIGSRAYHTAEDIEVVLTERRGRSQRLLLDVDGKFFLADLDLEWRPPSLTDDDEDDEHESGEVVAAD